jgi:hypothetical protein
MVCGRVGWDSLCRDVGEAESFCPHDLLALGNDGGDSRDVPVVTQVFEPLLEFRDRASGGERASATTGYRCCDDRKRQENRNAF